VEDGTKGKKTEWNSKKPISPVSREQLCVSQTGTWPG